MTKLSTEELDEIVARVTASVLRELKGHEAAFKGELRLPLTDATKLGDDVAWAPWTVAMPPSVKRER